MDEKQLVMWIRHLIATGNIRKFYNSKKYWRPLREQVLKEQHYECQRCKAQGKAVPAVTVHHIKPVRLFPALALTKSNLEVLCGECHYKEHHKEPHGNEPTEEERNRISSERW